MKKQRHGASRTRKTARLTDLAPDAARRATIKAGATSAFMAPQVLTVPTAATDQGRKSESVLYNPFVTIG